MAKKEYAFYMDESGSPKPSQRDTAKYFAVGGVLIERQHEASIELTICDFKNRWGISQDVPLHGNEIRSQKKHFAWLGTLSNQDKTKFFDDLTETIVGCPIIVHGCVVSREGYLDRYLDKYGTDTWEMMRSSFSIVLERVGKFVAANDGNVMVFFEKAGKKEDRLMKQYFDELRKNGPPFNQATSSKYAPLGAEQRQRCLSGIDSKTKKNKILQIADLCLNPVATSKHRPDNKAFRALSDAGRLIDSKLSEQEVPQLGIKYYCFDSSV